jgi:hypothetical protein
MVITRLGGEGVVIRVDRVTWVEIGDGVSSV